MLKFTSTTFNKLHTNWTFVDNRCAKICLSVNMCVCVYTVYTYRNIFVITYLVFLYLLLMCADVKSFVVIAKFPHSGTNHALTPRKKTIVFSWVVSKIWQTCPYVQLLMNYLTTLLLQINLPLILLHDKLLANVSSHLGVIPICKVWLAHMRQWCYGESRVEVCVLPCFTLKCEHKTNKGRNANCLGINHLTKNDGKQSKCEHSL